MAEALRIRRRDPGQPEALPDSLHPVLRRIYAARGLRGPEDVDHRLAALLPPTLGGLELAAGLLADAMARDDLIVIVGDYDADGATSTALAISSLQAMGARRLDFIVPNRFADGYGLSPPIVEQARERGAQVLVTVDNGISSIAGVAAARAAGMRVVVTDHHLPGEQLPAADAIVNPNLGDDPFPSKHLAGVGVLFYLMTALRRELQARGHFHRREAPQLAAGLDLVALGTVADVVRLDRNNRILVEHGLRRMRAGRLRPGIRALLEVAGRDHRHLCASDLGFALGPRINAAGRLDDMSVGIRCLLASDEGEAMRLAAELNHYNAERRRTEAVMRDEAMVQVQASDAVGVCLFDEQWHEGVVGLVAGRVKEKLHRPVVAFAPAQADGLLKGSARSIPGVHIRDVLATIDAREPGLIDKFGGHAMAAGLSLPRAHLDRFRSAFDATCRAVADDEVLERVWLSDGPLSDDEWNADTVRAIESGGPWGQGFPEPMFDGEFEVLDSRTVGGSHQKYRLRRDDGRVVPAIHFGGAEQALTGRVRVLYHAGLNRFRGEETPEMRIAAMEPA